MKTFFRTLTALLTLLPLCGAFAEPLTIQDIDPPLPQVWQRAYGAEITRRSYDFRVDQLTRLQAESGPDFFLVPTNTADYAALRDGGWLLDLSSNPMIAADTAALPPVFRSVVVEENGAVYGVPLCAVFEDELYWIPEAWEAAGLSASSAPDSFAELLDFLAAYAAQPPEGFCVFTRCFEPNPPFTYRRWLLLLLTDIWSVQAYGAGQAPHFSQPDFIALAARTLEVGKALDAADPASEREKLRLTPLFYGGGGRGRGYTASGKAAYSLNNLLPHRVTAQQPRLISVSLELLCCRADSPWADMAPAMLGEAIPFRQGWKTLYLHPDLGNLERVNAEISVPTARFTPEWLSSLSALTLTPVAAPRFYASASRDAYLALIDGAVKGSLSAEQFARELDGISQE